MIDEEVGDQPMTRGRRAGRRAGMVSIAVLVVLGALAGAAFIPKVANHFGYALPGEKGLPYQVHHNGRDYRSYLTCAGAQWCEDQKTPEQRARPYCTPRAELELNKVNGSASLVKVDDIFTWFGSSHPAFTTSAVPPGSTAMGVMVEASSDCYVAYSLAGGP